MTTSRTPPNHLTTTQTRTVEAPQRRVVASPNQSLNVEPTTPQRLLGRHAHDFKDLPRSSRVFTAPPTQMQPYLCITIPSTGAVLDPVFQHENLWTDTEGFTKATILLQILRTSNSTLVLSSSDSLDYGWGPEGEIFRGSSVGHYTIVLSRTVARSDPTRRLRRWIRWSLGDFTPPSFSCFRLQIELTH